MISKNMPTPLSPHTIMAQTITVPLTLIAHSSYMKEREDVGHIPISTIVWPNQKDLFLRVSLPPPVVIPVLSHTERIKGEGEWNVPSIPLAHGISQFMFISLSLFEAGERNQKQFKTFHSTAWSHFLTFLTKTIYRLSCGIST